MPTLRPLTEVARYDAKFFVDVVVPALSSAGYAGTLALAPDEGDVVIIASDAELDALFAGKQKTELSALDKLKQQKAQRTSSSSSSSSASSSSSSMSVRGSAESLRELVRALSPKSASSSKSRDVAAEASALVKTRSRDRVRRADGRYIKGIRPGGRKMTASVPSSSTAALVDAGRPPLPTDRVAFALANLRTFIEAGLAKVEADDDVDGALVITPGAVHRE